MSVTSLISRMPSRWARATRHPFLEAVGTAASGSGAAFARWMAQDVLFVRDLVAFQSRLVARAPRSAQRVLADGVVGLLAELDWFDEQAAEFGVDLAAEPLPVTMRYRDLLQRLDASPYPTAVVGLWTLERVYLDAWGHAGAAGGGGPYAAAVDHWTDPAFAAYVSRLEQAADDALVDATEGRLLEMVGEILELEGEFWDMAWPAGKTANP